MNSKKLKCLIFFMCITSIAQSQNGPYDWKNYEKVLGLKNNQHSYSFDVSLIKTTTPENVLWPGDKPVFIAQVINNLDTSMTETGSIEIIHYGTKGIPGDVWLPEMFKIATVQTIPVKITAEANKYCNIDFTPEIPETFGGYAIVLDLGKHGRRLITSLVRTFAATSAKIQYPKQSLDDMGPEFLSRIGVQSIRLGIDYMPTTYIDYRTKMQEIDLKLREYQQKNITVLLLFGAGQNLMPLGTPRSILDANNVMQNTKQDLAWLPSLDDDFKEFVEQFCVKYGWPNGPVTAVSLFNEPWEGISIAGWQADMLRYREIYTKMADGVLAARKKGADVLVGGTDSHSNALDKLFPDGKLDFLPVFDFVSVHYEGMESSAIYPEWINRKSPNGRVKIWDTESWVGNTDDRIGVVVGVNRSAGYDRSMGINVRYMSTGTKSSDEKCFHKVYTKQGFVEEECIPQAWSPTVAMGTVQHLIGEREFKEIVFKKGLPWIFDFEGSNGNKDDGTILIAGDIGDAFGTNQVLHRSVDASSEVDRKELIRNLLKTLSPDDRRYDSLATELDTKRSINNGRMTITAQPSFKLYNFYGNLIAPENGKLTVPLNCSSYFLRTDGSSGSYDKLLIAIKSARVDGYEPLEIIAKDFTMPMKVNAKMDIQLTNVLNRPVNGELKISLGKLSIIYPSNLSLKAFETKTVSVTIVQGVPQADNNYPLAIHFLDKKNGMAVHYEDMHSNVIQLQPIIVDGKLDDWKDAVPQTVSSNGNNTVSVTEAAWYPFKNFNNGSKGFANAYLGYDKNYFYFASKVADNTPNPGTYRFASRPDDDFFYPDTSYIMNANTSLLSHYDSATVDNKQAIQSQNKNNIKPLLHYIENANTTNSFAVDVMLPDNNLTQVAICMPSINVWKATIKIYDLKTGTLLYSKKVDNLWEGVTEVFNLSGKVRIVFQSGGSWYTVKVAGLFFNSTSVKAAGASADFVMESFEPFSKCNLLFGKDGSYIPGTNANFSSTFSIEIPQIAKADTLVWPKDTRRFSYRKQPILPDNSGLGETYDNVLISFNAIAAGEDGLLANPPGTTPGYIGYKCTDYEYALNKVDEKHGGGTEIWRLLAPGLNRKHFFPRQPKSALEGAVTNGKLTITREGSTLIYECAIPWSEIPDVKKKLDMGETIKFSYRVNDGTAIGNCVELAKGRSVSKINARAFHPDWKEHWANEVEFGFKK